MSTVVNDTISPRQDVRVTLPDATNRKCTLVIENGDIKLVSGRNKLVTQLIRSIVNDSTALKDLINATGSSERQLLTLITVILNNFMSNQNRDINEIDKSFTGYNIYRRAAGSSSNYEKVSNSVVTHYFIDTNLSNGTNYTYALKKVYNGVLESAFVDTFTITPSYYETQQDLIIGNNSFIEAGDQSATIFVVYNKRVIASEVLNNILSVVPYQDSIDPRIWHVNITVEDYEENQIGIATGSVTLT